MKHSSLIVIALAIVTAAGCQRISISSTTSPAATGTRMLADFEDGPGAWEGTGGGKIAVSAEHATSGKASLRADLPGPADYPGVGIEFKQPQDWSDCQALRLAIFNDSKDTVKLSVRADDFASKSFGTRYNGDMYPFKLAPGANEIEITMAALRQGSFLARGLDVSKMRQIRFFTGTKKPQTLYLDSIRLVCEKPGPAGAVNIAAFDGKDTAKWAVGAGVTAAVSGPKADQPGDARLDVTADPGCGAYPGVNFNGMERDWLTYQFLTMDVNVAEGPEALDLSAKLTDSTGRSQTVAIPRLKKGLNKICIPLEIFAEVSLGKVSDLSLFTSVPSQTVRLSLDNVQLRRLSVEEFPTVHDDKDEIAPLRLDLSKHDVPRNTCYMCMVFIPLENGKTRIVRCNAPDKGPTAYAIPAAAFAGAAKDKPVQVYVFVSDHGVWSYWPQSYVPSDAAKTLEFVAGKFAK